MVLGHEHHIGFRFDLLEASSEVDGCIFFSEDRKVQAR